MKVKVDVLGSPSLIILTVSMLVKRHFKKNEQASQLWSCVKLQVDVLGSPSLVVLTVSMPVKQHFKKKNEQAS